MAHNNDGTGALVAESVSSRRYFQIRRFRGLYPPQYGGVEMVIDTRFTLYWSARTKQNADLPIANHKLHRICEYHTLEQATRAMDRQVNEDEEWRRARGQVAATLVIGFALFCLAVLAIAHMLKAAG